MRLFVALCLPPAVKPAILSDGLTLTLQGAGSFGSLWWIELAASL